MSTPQTRVNICSGVRINSRYEHTIYFEDAAAQRSYFAGKTVKVLLAYSYLRKKWPLKVEATMEEAKTWNYLFFQNGSSGKIYYYFINTVEYVNDNTVELGLELDVMQTYHFDYNLRQCFIERMHVDDDTIGLHTIDEGLDIGEIADIACTDINLGDYAIMILASINPNAESAVQAKKALPYSYNGVFSGLKIWAVEGTRWAAWGTRLETLDSLGVADGIISMWMYPKDLIVLGGEATWFDDLCVPVERALNITESIAAGEGLEYRVTKPKPGDAFIGTTNEAEEYVPRNNKLYCFPYNYLYVTNNQGSSAAYHYERFGGVNPGFAVSGALSQDGGVRLTPINYDNLHINYLNGLTLSGFPSCAWDSDMYKMWLAQNQHTNALNMATAQLKVAGGAASAVVGAFTGGGVGAGVSMALSGAEQIASHLAQKADRAIEPPQAKGNFSTSVNITDGRHCFSVYHRAVNTEIARCIDDYFDMYGYKLNTVGLPQRCNREAYTYVKTVGCKIVGNMCNEDTVAVEGIFDRGITFWVDGDTIGDYHISNNPVFHG